MRSLARCAALLCVVPVLHAAEPLAIAAAADLTYCLEELNRDFVRRHPDAAIKVSAGASGNLFTQLRNGAPFDVFLSADVSFPRRLIEAGLAQEESLTTYAFGHLVVWTNVAGIDVSPGLAVVNDAGVKKFAVANPEHAPYGRAAKAALEHERLWAAAQKKLVIADNIAQTAQFVQTRNAQAGVVALSLVLSPALAKVGAWKEIPAEFYPPLEQAAVITAHGAGNPLAATYIAFLRSAGARAIFERYGFRLPKK